MRSSALSRLTTVGSTIRSYRSAITFRRIRLETQKVSVRERRDELIRFYDNYELLVDILCDAARYGPVPKLETSYSQIREFLPNDYKVLRPFLSAYVRPSKFEKLWSAESLDAIFMQDDGDLIQTIMDTRNAINMYAEHLRQLAAISA